MRPADSRADQSKPHGRLVTAGYLLAFGSLLLPLLWLPALIVGIIALARRRIVAGIVVLVLSQVLAAVGGTLYSALLVKPFRVASESMAPTLALGERFLVDRVSYRFGEPDRGDIVVFKPPEGAQTDECGSASRPDQPCERPTPGLSDVNFVMRVVAGPGDRVAIRGGRLVRNGELQREPFIRPCAAGVLCELPRETGVPSDHYFVLGDNRGAASDSRSWGPVPRDWIIGRKWVTYWGA